MKKTSDLCDACAEIVVCKTPLRSFGQIRSFYGEIKTVQCDGDITKMREAVNLPGRGMVLVVDNAGILEHAVFGDVMAGLAIQNEWAGLIIYGAIRDVDVNTEQRRSKTIRFDAHRRPPRSLSPCTADRRS